MVSFMWGRTKSLAKELEQKYTQRAILSIRKLLFFAVFIWCTLINIHSALGQTPKRNKAHNVYDTFPVPKENKNIMFYIQRTLNKNTIIYELNYNADSTLNELNPIKIYWVRYADNGGIEPLSYIQKTYAYGLKSELTDPVKKTFKLNLVSYNKRAIYLMKSGSDKQYHAYLLINNKLVYFIRAFAKIDGGTFWLPHITYVELTGKDPLTGDMVSEKIIP